MTRNSRMQTINQKLLFFYVLPPFFVLGEAVFARCLSSLKEERVKASHSLSGPQGVKFSGNKAAFLEDIRKVELTVQFIITATTGKTK